MMPSKRKVGNDPTEKMDNPNPQPKEIDNLNRQPAEKINNAYPGNLTPLKKEMPLTTMQLLHLQKQDRKLQMKLHQ